MQCVSTVNYTFQVNRGTTKPFQAKRGVRQSDPMSPFLFVIAMEYLTRALKQLHNDPEFHYHPRCKNQRIVQHSFADDLLLFRREDIKSVRGLYKCFQEFSKASGLVANVDKSNVYFRGVKHGIQDQIL